MMKSVNTNKTVRIFFLLVFILGLPGCSSDVLMFPFGIAKGVVEAIAEDRHHEDIEQDLQIKARLIKGIADDLGAKKALTINADVYEGRVLLSGLVETNRIRNRAAVLAKSAEGVKRVYNEIRVIAPEKRKKSMVRRVVDDTVIEGKINGLLLNAKGVNVTNFRWRSTGGYVVLFGRALSQKEKNKASQIVKQIDGVETVKNLAFVRAKTKDS